MTRTYIFRAGLETESYVEVEENRMQELSIPKQLPIEFGPFRLDKSPNSEFYLAQLGYKDLPPGIESLDEPPPDQDYPNSILYVEANIEVKDSEDPEAAADERLEELEAMLRLFQRGNVSLRRNLSIGTRFKKNGELTWFAFVFSRPIKPKPEPLYRRHPYLIDDVVIDQFKQYFSRYWETVHRKPERIYNALRRFSSSYEERVSSDRLLELVIGLESLFGGGAGSIAYKVALRASCLLYPPGEDRKGAFKRIKRAYDDRSKLIHGVRSHAKYEEEIDAIEELLRKAIKKFLEYDVTDTQISSEEDLDNLLFLEISSP
jgi:hypothetical protein